MKEKTNNGEFVFGVYMPDEVLKYKYNLNFLHEGQMHTRTENWWTRVVI